MSEPMPERPPAGASGLELGPGVAAPASAVRMQFARSGGPGGQNVNKLNTRAELWVRVEAIEGMSPRALDRLRRLAGKRLTQAGEIHLSAESSRSQEGNRRAVLQRLREMVIRSLREPKVRRKTRPSAAARRRRLEEKRRRSAVKASRRAVEE